MAIVGGMTLTEAAKYTLDMLQRGIIETMIDYSELLEVLPFMEVEGNAYAYNLEVSLSPVAFRAVNTGYTPGEGEIERRAENLYILGGDIDIDNFIIRTRSNINDIRAIQTGLKARAVAQAYSYQFFNGAAGSNTEFEGLASRIVANNAAFGPAGTYVDLRQDTPMVIAAGSTQPGATAGQLAINDLNTLIDAVHRGPTHIFCNKTARRIILQLLQNSQHYIEYGQDAFGRPVLHFAGVPIRILNNEIIPYVAATGTNIYAIRLGVLDGTCGLQNGNVQIIDFGELQALPVVRSRIEWYCSMACFDPRSAAMITGVKSAYTPVA